MGQRFCYLEQGGVPTKAAKTRHLQKKNNCPQRTSSIHYFNMKFSDEKNIPKQMGQRFCYLGQGGVPTKAAKTSHLQKKNPTVHSALPVLIISI
jgi:ribosomal protein L35